MNVIDKADRSFRVWAISVYFVIWCYLAIAPLDRADWLLENVLVLLFAIVLLLTWKKYCLSRTSILLLSIYMSLHAIGAHYSYSNVPYDMWAKQYLGFSIDDYFGFERNNFDRLVHFSYGLLLAYPLREVLMRGANLRGFWSYFLPLDVTMSTSMLYELIEWGAAESFGGELGVAYLGTQGDIWDAHKDMALASIGAFVAMLITYLIVIISAENTKAAAHKEMRVRFPKF